MTGSFTHVAFLRGMNLGKRRITNVELVAAFRAIGYPDAVAYQASGNVMLDAGDAPDPAGVIAEGLGRELGYPVPTFLRSAEAVRCLADAQPFPPAEEMRGKLQVTFLAGAPDPAAIEAAEAFDTPVDRIRVIGTEWFWWPAGGISESELDVAALEKLLGQGTTRTQATLQRIAKKL